jgi:hypothetical protein
MPISIGSNVVLAIRVQPTVTYFLMAPVLIEPARGRLADGSNRFFTQLEKYSERYQRLRAKFQVPR